MANYTVDRITYGSNTYILNDSAALPRTGGTVDELSVGNLVVTGNGSFSNNIQANTINGVTVGSSPKFTDNNTTYSAGTGLSLSSTTFSLATSGVTAGSYGPSANASPAHGGTFSVPYITVDTYGRVTAASTKTITLPAGYSAGTGLSLSSNSFSLATSGATAGSYGPSSNASPAHSGTFSVPYITVDTYGRVTAASTKTITLPASGNTDTKVKITAVTPADETTNYPLTYTATSGTVEVNAHANNRFWYKQGTASVAGYVFLGLGNGTAAGTANNSYGCLRLYGNGTKYAQIRYDTDANATANTNHYLPEVSSTIVGITEEGAWGDNGHYVKYTDGTSECYGYAKVNTSVALQYGNAYYHNDNGTTATFPSGVFTAGPVINITIERNTNGLYWASIRQSTKDNVKFFIASSRQESTAADTWYHVMARGRWK